MSSGALFGSTSGRSQSKNLVEFRAGKMTMRGRTVYPDKRKGMVYIYQSDDSLMHFCWRERSKSTAEDVSFRLFLETFTSELSKIISVDFLSDHPCAYVTGFNWISHTASVSPVLPGLSFVPRFILVQECLFTRPSVCCPPSYIYSYGQLKISRTLWYKCILLLVIFYCPYAQNINCGKDISVETDECRHFWVVNIDVELQQTAPLWYDYCLSWWNIGLFVL